MDIRIRSLFRRGRSHKSEPTLHVAGADKPAAPQGDDLLLRRERRASFKRGAIYAVDSIALSPFR